MSQYNNKVAVGYVRVSTSIQAEEGHSIETQKKNIKDYCTRKNLIFDRFYIDSGRSGKDMSRPYLQQMLGDLQRGTVVIVVSGSRLTRNADDDSSIRKIISERGCSLVTLDQEYVEQSTPDGKFRIGLNALMSQFEREQTSQRVSNVLNNLSREGKLITKPRFGYKVVKEGKISYVVEDPDEQAVINIIRNILKDDPLATPSHITKLLNNQGVKMRKTKTIRPDYVKKIILINDLRPRPAGDAQ